MLQQESCFLAFSQRAKRFLHRRKLVFQLLGTHTSVYLGAHASACIFSCRLKSALPVICRLKPALPVWHFRVAIPITGSAHFSVHCLCRLKSALPVICRLKPALPVPVSRSAPVALDVPSKFQRRRNSAFFPCRYFENLPKIAKHLRFPCAIRYFCRCWQVERMCNGI